MALADIHVSRMTALRLNGHWQKSRDKLCSRVTHKLAASRAHRFSGLPGAGKTTLAQALARNLHAGYVRIDTIEDALLAEGGSNLVDAGAGYRVAYAMAEDNLRLGRTVIADSVNPIRLTREAWRDIGKRVGSIVVDVQVICSDKTQHRHRIEARDPDTRASNWLEIINRDFDAVDHTTIVIDTAGQTVEQSLATLQMAVSARIPQLSSPRIVE